MLDGRTFDPIVRRPKEDSQTLARQRLDPLEVAALVLDPEVEVGLRHLHKVRLLTIDFDRHPGPPRPITPAPAAPPAESG